jgi:bifunctional DNase/RNase
MQKIELEIVALSHSITQSNSYAVILGEVNGIRRLPIVIGGFEAQAIAVALENMHPARPLTHDLMKNFMTAFDINLQEVYICDLQEGIFYSKLVCFTANDTIEIDSRTSDALALAVRFGCPIYVYAHILEQAGIENESGEINQPAKTTIANNPNNQNDLSSLSIDQLNDLLSEVLEQEDYLRAIDIRDEISKRNEHKKS